MNIAAEDLVAIGPDRDAALGAVSDFKAIDDIVVTIDIDADVTVGCILSIERCRSWNLRAQDDRAGSGAAAAQMKPPTA